MPSKKGPDAEGSGTVPAGSTTIDHTGTLDIGNKDLDENPALGDETSGEGEGSVDVGDKDGKKPDEKDSGKPGEQDKDKPDANQETPVKYKGKTAAELLAILKDGEKHQGKQSTEIGELREAIKALTEQNQQLVTQLSGKGNAAEGGEQAGDPHQAKLAELEAQLDKGQITPAEFSKAIMALGETRTQSIVNESLAKNQQMQADQLATQQFLEMNPDFEDFRAQGILDKIKAQFPVHDNVSAYEFVKRLELQSKLADVQAELAALKQAQADSVAAGRVGTQKVLQQPGTGNKTVAAKRKGSFSESDAVDSMLSALQRTRES